MEVNKTNHVNKGTMIKVSMVSNYTNHYKRMCLNH